MRAIQVDRQPSAATRQAIADFVGAIAHQLGERPVSDHTWLALTAENAEQVASVIARELVPTPANADPTMIAVGLVSVTNDGQMLEVAVAPGVDDREAVLADVGETACELLVTTTGRLTWWLDDPSELVLTIAAEHGLSASRRLHEMRRRLPTGVRSELATRPFRQGVDEAAWLAVNNRAFAEHPEQGGWTRELLATRMAEAWFDPDGFRLYDVDGELAGFCWTKVHTRGHDRVGEIYVIGVDPARQGGGLGRQLTLAGLDWLADHAATEAMLYVDGANASAIRVYERLGFEIVRTRTALTTRP